MSTIVNKHGVELPKTLKPGDKIVYEMEANRNPGEPNVSVIEIVSVYADYKQKYNVKVVESEDWDGNDVKKFGMFNLGEEFRCVIDYQNITFYDSYNTRLVKADLFDAEWEKL